MPKANPLNLRFRGAKLQCLGRTAAEPGLTAKGRNRTCLWAEEVD